MDYFFINNLFVTIEPSMTLQLQISKKQLSPLTFRYIYNPGKKTRKTISPPETSCYQVITLIRSNTGNESNQREEKPSDLKPQSLILNFIHSLMNTEKFIRHPSTHFLVKWKY